MFLTFPVVNGWGQESGRHLEAETLPLLSPRLLQDEEFTEETKAKVSSPGKTLITPLYGPDQNEIGAESLAMDLTLLSSNHQSGQLPLTFSHRKGRSSSVVGKVELVPRISMPGNSKIVEPVPEIEEAPPVDEIGKAPEKSTASVPRTPRSEIRKEVPSKSLPKTKRQRPKPAPPTSPPLKSNTRISAPRPPSGAGLPGPKPQQAIPAIARTSGDQPNEIASDGTRLLSAISRPPQSVDQAEEVETEVSGLFDAIKLLAEKWEESPSVAVKKAHKPVTIAEPVTATVATPVLPDDNR